MPLLLDYCAPPTRKLRQYVKSLYERREEGLYVARQPIRLDDWQPSPNHCHANTLILESYGRGLSAVHGWLYMDFEGSRDYVRFIAHSVIRDQSGNLIDVTPAATVSAPLYPFIRANVTNTEYEMMLNMLINVYGRTDCLDYSCKVGGVDNALIADCHDDIGR